MNLKATRLIAIVTALSSGVLACHCKEPDRTFDNPNDPNPTQKKTDPESSTTTGSTSSGKSTSTSGTTSGTSAPTASTASDTTGGGSETSTAQPPAPTATSTTATSSTCLLSSCNAPAEAVFDFRNSFSLTPTGCSAAANVQSFDTGTELRHFVQANCGTRSLVYTFATTYAGNNPSTVTNVTNDCNSGATGVESFAADKGANEYLVAYSCFVSASSHSVRMVPVAFDGTVGTVVNYETVTAAPAIWIAWNAVANAYGFLRAGKFQRFTGTAASLGGSISVSSNGPTVLRVFSGNWYFSSYSGNNLCSKVNSSGTLQCNAVLMAPYLSQWVSDTAIIGTNSGGLMGYSFNAATCAATSADLQSDYPNLTNLVSQTFGSLGISSSIAGFLYSSTSSKNLVFATLSLSGTPTIYAESAIANYSTSITATNVKIIDNRLYVFYASDGAAYGAYTAQTLP